MFFNFSRSWILLISCSFCYGFLVWFQLFIELCTTKYCQCSENPVTTAVLKHFQGIKFIHKTKLWTPNLSAELPLSVIKYNFKPNSNLNEIFFTHPVFSGILCWFPFSSNRGWIKPSSPCRHTATPPCDISSPPAREGTEIPGFEIMSFVTFLFLFFF